MRRPQFTLKTLLWLMAVMAALSWLAQLKMRYTDFGGRAVKAKEIAEFCRGWAEGCEGLNGGTPSNVSRVWRQRADHFEEVALKYSRAASTPWKSVTPDGPVPGFD